MGSRPCLTRRWRHAPLLRRGCDAHPARARSSGWHLEPTATQQGPHFTGGDVVWEAGCRALGDPCGGSLSPGALTVACLSIPSRGPGGVCPPVTKEAGTPPPSTCHHRPGPGTLSRSRRPTERERNWEVQHGVHVASLPSYLVACAVLAESLRLWSQRRRDPRLVLGSV